MVGDLNDGFRNPNCDEDEPEDDGVARPLPPPLFPLLILLLPRPVAPRAGAPGGDEGGRGGDEQRAAAAVLRRAAPRSKFARWR